jgi:L-asparaginase
LIIFTGGTIGSSVKDGYISVDEEKIDVLVREALGSSGGAEQPDIEVVTPYTILSETLDGTHIAALVRCIDERKHKCDGIIVCHGTDTLQYTAAALEFAFADAGVPIVLVSSNYVLEDPRANGRANMKAAVEFVTGRSGIRRSGVWVSYKNEYAKNEAKPAAMYEPFELLPHQAYDDSLYVMSQGGVADNAANAVANSTHDIITDDMMRNATFSSLCDHLGFDCAEMKKACMNLGKCSGILWIKAYPGMSYSGYIREYVGEISGILLDSYHSGTINTSDSGLRELTDWADENDIPVYLIGLKTGVSYETTRGYNALGIKILPEMSPVTAYMWLWISGSDISGQGVI